MSMTIYLEPTNYKSRGPIPVCSLVRNIEIFDAYRDTEQLELLKTFKRNLIFFSSRRNVKTQPS